MRRDVDIVYNLESTPLEIKTDGGNEARINFYTSADDYTGGVKFKLTSPPQYYISSCRDWTNFPTTPPTAQDKVWRITVIRSPDVITLMIHCNGNEVLNTVLSDSSCAWKSGTWRTYWYRGDIAIIHFPFSGNSMSDYYRPCPLCTAAGQYVHPETGCQNCPADHWSVAGNTATTCTACPSGKGVASGSGTQESDCSWSKFT